MTTTGTGYTSAPSVTIASGNSIWRPVLGSYVSSVTIPNGGVNYTYAPTVTFSAPPAGGIQATGIAGHVGRRGLLGDDGQQGRRLSLPADRDFHNDSREGLNGVVSGYNAAGVAVLSATGGVTAVVCTDPGNTTYTATTTFTTSGGGGSGLVVTPIFCLAITRCHDFRRRFLGATAVVEVRPSTRRPQVSASLNPSCSTRAGQSP